jgi:hypothetical protein
MHWELWALNTGNLIATPSSEAEALALVRELLAKGWSADDLSLGVEDEGQPVESLPTPLEGAELAARARAASPPSGRARRSA